jgi:hypothetical protein
LIASSAIWLPLRKAQATVPAFQQEAKLRTIVSGLLLLTATAAYGDPGQSFAEKAVSCWDLPVGGADMEPAIFTVALDNEGELLDVTVLNYSRDRPDAVVFVTSALRAMRICSPYELTAGEMRVVMDPAKIPPKGINPFK